MEISPRLLAALKDYVLRIMRSAPGPIQTAYVATVNAEGSVDLRWGGDPTAVTPSVRYLSSYTPVAGQQVRVYVNNGDHLVLGAVQPLVAP